MPPRGAPFEDTLTKLKELILTDPNIFSSDLIGKIVIGLLKYVIGPVLLALLIMGFIVFAARGGI